MNLSARIQKRLSENFALDVELSAPAGISMLFGASGSGKTTLLRCVAGLLRPDRGLIQIGEEILFDSGSAVDVPTAQRNVGFVFQNLSLFPHLTVSRNIQYGLHKLGQEQMRQRTEQILEAFRIPGLRNRKPNEISGGERQRVALARTLVTNPRVLLLDEPLSALDRRTQSQIIEDLRVWNASHGIPILYVTHSRRELFALGEQVIVLQDGKILSHGTPQEVLDEPVRESLAQLAGFENFFDAKVLSVNAGSGTMHCRLAGADTELEVPLSKVQAGGMVRIAIRAGDILIAAELPRALSARNILPGRIRSWRREYAKVIAEIDAGRDFEVHLTPSACESLRLAVDQQVWLVIKTHSCHLVAP